MSTVVYEAARPLERIPANPFAEAVGLIRTAPTVATPDLHVYLAALPLSPPTVAGPTVGYSIVYAAMAPRSRGSVRLASVEPTTPPVVDPDYLGDERDVETMLEGFRIARRIGDAAALAPWRKSEAFPGPELGRDDDSVRDYLNHAVRTYLHPVGTCRMGVDDMAVVDPGDLRVHGLAGLRVADASVMPSIVSANTNATVYAIAERAAHLIRSE
jgi:choline dehydrogenase